jgi:protein tyrosine phosphatase (PTP) superfamily phosphohydrolase (DUF442 family)
MQTSILPKVPTMTMTPVTLHTRLANLAFASFMFCSGAPAQAAELSAPNIVPITPQLVTAGQPSKASLAALGELGFDADIYLAPPSVPDAVRDEGAIVGSQGLVFVNIPIRFGNPTEQDYELVAGALNALRGKKVLVHCQVNMRASSMVFLYRVLAGKEDPEHAYQDVARVWTPDGKWKEFIVMMLRKHGIAFEPY